jgi:hypothetical protein
MKSDTKPIQAIIAFWHPSDTHFRHALNRIAFPNYGSIERDIGDTTIIAFVSLRGELAQKRYSLGYAGRNSG